MFELIFEDTGQAVFYKIDKNTKSVYIKTFKTGYEWKRKPWHYLSDKGIIWLDLYDKEGKIIKKVPVSIDKAIKRGKLRKQHKVSKKELIKLNSEVDINALKEMEEIEKLTEEELMKRMIKRMEEVGYKLKNAKLKHA